MVIALLDNIGEANLSLDVSFSEDENKTKTYNSAENL
jgi:hypothetical protein